MCTRLNYKIVPVTNLNICLHYGTSGTEYIYIYMCVCVCVCVCVCTHITAVKNYEQKKNSVTSGKLIKAVYASYVYVNIFCTHVSQDG